MKKFIPLLMLITMAFTPWQTSPLKVEDSKVDPIVKKDGGKQNVIWELSGNIVNNTQAAYENPVVKVEYIQEPTNANGAIPGQSERVTQTETVTVNGAIAPNTKTHFRAALRNNPPGNNTLRVTIVFAKKV